MRETDEVQNRLAELEAREKELARREAAFAAKGLRNNLYDRVNLSAKAVDAIIIACILAIILAVAVGMYLGND